MKRNRNDRRRKWWRPRYVDRHRWEPVEPKGDLWIKGPRRIRLSPMYGETYPDDFGVVRELWVVQ